MASGINIAIDVDESGATKGITKVDEALEKVADSLDGVGKDGTSDLGKLETSIKDVSRESLKAGDDIKSGFGKKVKDSAKDAESGMEDFKSEANQTAKETAASFDGSAESIVDMFQETAANALSGFGPAGALAGLALAAGIGIATAEFQKSEEAAAKAKQRIQDMGQAMIDAGAEGEVPLDSIIESLQGIVLNSEDATKSFKDIRLAAKLAGQDAGALATAYAGGTEALDDQIDAYDKLIEQQKAEKVEGENGSAAAVTAYNLKLKALEDTKNGLVKVREEQQLAAEAEQAWLASGGNELIAKAEMVNAVNTSYDDLASSTTDFINAESGLFDTSAYITAMQERETALADYQKSLTTSGLSPEAQQFLNSQGIEAASQMLAGYKSSGPQAKAELDRIWKEASKTASGSVKTNLDGVVNEKRTAKITADVDTATAQANLDALTKKRIAQVQVDFIDRYGKKVP